MAHPVISLNTFYGAVCVYLLIAMFFATTYGLIALFSGEQFFAQLTMAAKDTPAIDYLYFSFVTITTTGYGDLTAATGVGRMTAVLEAIFGQLYLITVVALVVQNLGQRSRMGRKMEEQLEQTAQDARQDDPQGDDRLPQTHVPPTRLPPTPTPEPRRRPRRPVAHACATTARRRRHMCSLGTSTSERTLENTIVFLSVRTDVPHRNLHTRRGDTGPRNVTTMPASSLWRCGWRAPSL